MTVSLSLDYDAQLPSMRRLLELSERSQWYVTDVDWSQDPSGGNYGRVLEWQGVLRSSYVASLPDADKERLARQFVAFEFSQLLHGEQCAMMLAGQLINTVDDLDARMFAASQVRDEARHVEAVRRAVTRIGPIYPVAPTLHELMADLLNCPVWPKQVLALQLFLEARALLVLRQHQLFVDDPVLCATARNVERDESQHVAFGIQYLTRGINAMTAEQKEDIIQYGMWLDGKAWAKKSLAHYGAVFDECNLDFKRFQATFQPPSKLHPSRGRSAETARAVESLDAQFRRWFQGALNKVGLKEVIERGMGRQFTEDEQSAWAELDGEVIPWARAEDAAAEPSPARAPRRLRPRRKPSAG